MKKILIVAMTFSLLQISVSYAHDGGDLSHKGKYLRAMVCRAYGCKAAGRDIIRNDLEGGKAPSKHLKAKYIRQLRKLLMPTNQIWLGTIAVPPPQPPADVLTASVEGTGVNGSANPYVDPNCESNGYADKRNPKYRGRYQFDQSTWDAYAPTGYQGTDPANAPPAIQDQAAANVPYDAWPNC